MHCFAKDFSVFAGNVSVFADNVQALVRKSQCLLGDLGLNSTNSYLNKKTKNKVKSKPFELYESPQVKT
jgi:hypothetical protein